MERIVKKFGGSCLSDGYRRELAAREVSEELGNGNEVLTVVSAMGNESDPYSTDSLIRLLEEVSTNINPRKQDLLMSCGETISAAVFSHYLDKKGHSSVPMTCYSAGILTDENFGNAEVLDIKTSKLETHLSRGEPVVLAGFQGRTVRGEVTTLGRGGSDTTALEVAAKLGADRAELFTDVPGVAVVDPNVVEDPPFFSEISREALLALAENGAKVVHPDALEAAANYEIPIHVKSFLNKGNETLVSNGSSSRKLPLAVAQKSGFTLLTGPSKSVVRAEGLFRQAEELFHLDGERSLALIPNKVEEPSGNGFKRQEEISAVTVVGTAPDLWPEARRKLISSLDRKSYIERLTYKNQVKFLIESEHADPLVKRIYSLFYSN